MSHRHSAPDTTTLMIDIKRTMFTRLELAGSGTIDRHDVQRTGEALTEALADGGHATLLIDLRAVEDMTMRALTQDASLGARLQPMLERLDGVALVGDADWLDPLSAWRKAAASSLHVRRFPASDIERARRWLLDGAGQAPRPEREAASEQAAGGGAGEEGAVSGSGGAADPLREMFSDGANALEGMLESMVGALESRTSKASGRSDRTRSERSTGKPANRSVHEDAGTGLHLEEHDGLLVLDLDGRIGREDVERVAAHLDTTGGDGVMMLARLTRFDGIDPAALTSPALWRLKGEGLSRLSRVALVTSMEWLRRAVESSARMHRVEVRSFAPQDEKLACAWLEEDRTAA